MTTTVVATTLLRRHLAGDHDHGHNEMDVLTSTSVSSSSPSSHDVGIAFLITIIAGLATAIGGLIVFVVPHIVHGGMDKDNGRSPTTNMISMMINPKCLSASLSFAAGAIIYLVIGDLFPESNEFFVHGIDDPNFATLYGTLSFFGGILVMIILSWMSHQLHPNHHHNAGEPSSTLKEDAATDVSTALKANQNLEIDQNQQPDKGDMNEPIRTQPEQKSPNEGKDKDVEQQQHIDDDDHTEHDTSLAGDANEDERKNLWYSGISTGIALFLHNLPEGIVTYITASKDPVLGIALAIGIALHNIPEGMSVAIPMYVATGRKWYAFGISVLTGLAQPLGAFMVWSILTQHEFSEVTFGIMFGIAGGMLLYIAVKNLLRTAYKYDPQDTVTTTFFILGMVLLAMALVVLATTGNHSHDLGGGGDDHHGGSSSHASEWEGVSTSTMDDAHHHDGDDDHHHFLK